MKDSNNDANVSMTRGRTSPRVKIGIDTSGQTAFETGLVRKPRISKKEENSE